jgi:hypothetical protein
LCEPRERRTNGALILEEGGGVRAINVLFAKEVIDSEQIPKLLRTVKK